MDSTTMMNKQKSNITLVDKCPHINSDNITYVIGGKPVFKDQCQRCYEDPQCEGGLDVCLKCFGGNCRSEIFNHSNLHFMQKNHPVVLNIREVLVEEIKKEEGGEQKITKLAINKPGGIDLISNEKWEHWLSIHCKACNEDIDYIKNPQLNDLVTSILNTITAEKQKEANDWELEINPCEHTLTLQQEENVKIASKMKATCNDCNLSSNLWLCLTCGNLACGRKNYDGSGGNGHALEHYQKTKHPLAVKTGTITASGEASIYCYACDEDVKDPELPAHLSNFGINIATQVKTEKTMAELNLDFNLNFTLSKTIEEGKVLTPVYGPGNTGLENLGNSCYMNSILQILFSLEHFQKLYLDNALEHLNTCSNDPQNCFLCQMSKIMYGLHSGVYSNKLIRKVPTLQTDGTTTLVEEEYQKGIKPSSFKHFFNKGHKEFSTNKQQDAFEYFSYVLDIFERQEKLNKRPNPRKNFEFDIETRLECSKCHSVKYKNQKTCFLYLNVPNWENKREETTTCNFEEIVQNFLSEETVDLNCVNCKISTPYIKTQRIKSFPKYLIIIFGRFLYDWVAFKLETQVKFPSEINLELLAKEHRKEGEKIIEEIEESESSGTEEVEPEFDKSALNLLMQNGLTELAAKHALMKNDNNADLAIMWYFENMDNPVLNTPIPKIKKSSGPTNEAQPDLTLIESVVGVCGCSPHQAIGALKKCGNDPERAVDYIFSHPDEKFEEVGSQSEHQLQQQQCHLADVDSKEFNKDHSSLYDIYGFITHLGKNTSHGHYVAHIKKGDNWVYYNDSRVCLSDDPPLHKGYIFIYRNKK